METSVNEIRGVLVQITGARLLLPNALIAEVLSFAEASESAQTQTEWLHGHLRWRGWKVPLVSFSQMIGLNTDASPHGNRVLVLKALSNHSVLPYFAISTRGYPRLVTVVKSELKPTATKQEDLPPGIVAEVEFQDEPVFIPDLEMIEAMIRTAA